MKKAWLAIFLLSLVMSLAAQWSSPAGAWGDNSQGQCEVPHYWYCALAGGWEHSVGIKADGTLIAWGDNTYGQCNVPDGNNYGYIAGGACHSLALRADGTLVAWGSNADGQCNVPAGSFSAIKAGGYHSLALSTDGSLVAWGDNTYGQCEVPSGNDFIAISAGWYHNLALRADSTVVAWGRNEDGQCNVPAGIGFRAIAAGGWHSLALQTDCIVRAWGRNTDGQCDVPEGRFYSVSAGGRHSLAFRWNGYISTWGNNDFGQCDVHGGVGLSGSGIAAPISSGANHNLAKILPVELGGPFLNPTLTAEYYVHLSWITENSFDMRGYNLYRNNTNDFTGAICITPDIITANNTQEMRIYEFTDMGVQANNTYYYWLEAVDIYGDTMLYGPDVCTVTGQLVPPLPSESALGNVYPNPAGMGNTAKVAVSIKAGETGTLSIMNLKGQVVKTYRIEPGMHIIGWDCKDNCGRRAGCGLYFYKLDTPSVKKVIRFIILR